MDKTIRFKLNGKEVAVETSPERMLLWVLRTDLEHTGTKYGCGEGYCGFCTVLVDGKPERSCQLLEAYALLLRKPNPTEAEIADALEGNICRCGTYKRIIAAVQQASGAMKMKVVGHESR
jgi:aerobic-type carbon monoxide dehydrogenase small subunit (CoxS/CutS family)